MSRNLYILAATLLLFALISCGMSLLPSAAQPGLPGSGSLWKSVGLVLFLGSTLTAFAGVMTAMFEQVERRNRSRDEAERHSRGRRGSPPR